MSADLFAQFGPFSGSNNSAEKQQHGQSQPRTPAATQQADDPFTSFGTAYSQPLQAQAQTFQPHNPQPQRWSFDASVPVMGGDSGWGMSNSMAGWAVQPAAQNVVDNEDDETWGDFEEAPKSIRAQHPPIAAPTTYQAYYNTAPSASQPPKPGSPFVQAPAMDLLSNKIIDISGPRPRKPADPNVLFDADDFEVNGGFDSDNFDDDEFGDFETGHMASPSQTTATTNFFPAQPSASQAMVKPAPTPPAALVDLLSLSDPVPAAETLPLPINSRYQTPPSVNRQPTSLLPSHSFGSTAPAVPLAPKSPSYHDRKSVSSLAVTMPVAGDFSTCLVKNETPSLVTTSLRSPLNSAPATTKNVPYSEEADWEAWDLDGSESLQGAPTVFKDSKVSQAKSRSKAQPQPRRVSPTKPKSASSDWDWEAEGPGQVASAPATTVLPPAIANAPTQNTIPDKTPPPTNVPPPSVLLSHFLTLVALPDEALFKPTASEPAEVRNRVIGDPKTVAFLRNYLQIIVVAGRVIAGRKQRWHRDKYLSQSMSISSAGSSKGGGMKLAGLDKVQGRREDREAADVVAAWVRHVGKLRSAVATANAALLAAEKAEQRHYVLLKVPELQSATISVTVVKHVPTATKPCVICGLRRDERVCGIDGDDVEDIFSEWWIEHWGHRACRNFWAEHEAALRSR
ncbi:hypothetical protein SEPCBS57363_004719 [Sporothrix epigloea]|uniref:Serine/threonineeeee-protein kinase ppk6 n=1 Tax=Sporothrix epigloea TaxID=1892477 RepID=A0ABP0DTL4_9PEZI